MPTGYPWRTFAEVVEHIYANTRPEGGCLVTTRSRDRSGYARQSFRGRMSVASQLVACHYMGPCPDGQEVRHLCGRGNKGCVTASHLRYGTRRDNKMDSVHHGTARVGPLSVEQVERVRTLRKAGVPYRKIQRDMGVNPRTIRDIVTGATYSWAKRRKSAQVMLDD